MPFNMLVRLGAVLYRLSAREFVPEIQYMNGQPPVVFQGASEVKISLYFLGLKKAIWEG
jgi:hypothetical protein